MALIKMNYQEDDEGFQQRVVIFTASRIGVRWKRMSHVSAEAEWERYERVCLERYAKKVANWTQERDTL